MVMTSVTMAESVTIFNDDPSTNLIKQRFNWNQFSI